MDWDALKDTKHMLGSLAKQTNTLVRTGTGAVTQTVKTVGTGMADGVTGTSKLAGSALNKSVMGTVNIAGKTVNMAGKTVTGTLDIAGKGVLGTVNMAGKTVTGTLDIAGKGVLGTVNIATQAGKMVIGQGNNKRRNNLKRQDSRLAWDSKVTAPSIKLDLVIECRRLPKKDSFSQADAFCGLWEVPPGFSTPDRKVSKLPMKQEKEIGRTEVVRETKHPCFATTFRLEYKFQEEQTYVLRVYDEDLRYATDLKEHDYVGGCIFTLGELMGAGGCAIARPLQRGKAHVILLGKEIIETREVLEFRFSGQDLGLLERKHKVLTKDVLIQMQKMGKKVTKEVIETMQKVNVAKNVLDKFNPFFRLEKLNPEDQSWTVVWKSEVIKDNKHPTWNVARLPLQLLCDDKPNSPLKISLWVWNRFTPDELVGFIETTVSELALQAKRGIPVFNVMLEKRKLLGGTKLKKAGTLKILKANVVIIPSMLQYFAGGCQMDLVVAVDCSMANGDWQDEKSLHYRSGTWLNDYQAAIKKVGTIFEAYEGGEFTMWGYGARKSTVYQPSFAMGEKLNTAEQLLKAYDEAFADGLKQSKRCELSPVVQAAMYRAIRSNQDKQCYTTLVILSTGNLSDLQETVDAVCAAAEDAPLSIVIIGVGNGDFSQMQHLTGYFGKLQHSNGVPVAREIVHFCKFAAYHGNAGRCVSESLKEIPEQFVNYFMNAGIRPNPPEAIPDFEERK